MTLEADGLHKGRNSRHRNHPCASDTGHCRRSATRQQLHASFEDDGGGSSLRVSGAIEKDEAAGQESPPANASALQRSIKALIRNLAAI